MALIARQSAVSQKVCSPATVKAAPAPRSVRCKAYVPVELIAAGECCISFRTMAWQVECCHNVMSSPFEYLLAACEPTALNGGVQQKLCSHLHALLSSASCVCRAAAGDVDAPIAVPIVAAIVVTAAITFAVPAYLNRGEPCFGDTMGQHSSLPRGMHPSQHLKQRWWLRQHSDLLTASVSIMCILVGALLDVVMSPPPPSLLSLQQA
jgi:hypothetical protein